MFVQSEMVWGVSYFEAFAINPWLIGGLIVVHMFLLCVMGLTVICNVGISTTELSYAALFLNAGVYCFGTMYCANLEDKALEIEIAKVHEVLVKSPSIYLEGYVELEKNVFPSLTSMVKSKRVARAVLQTRNGSVDAAL